MNEFYCKNIFEIIKYLKQEGVDTTVLDNAVEDLHLKVKQFKELYKRNEHYNFKI